MAEAIEVTARGLQAGGVFAMIAIGVALIFSVSHVLNFAHGHMFMISTVVVWWAWQERGVALALTLVLAVVVVGLVAFFEERFVIRPTSRFGALGWVLSTLGFATVLAFFAQEILDNQPQSISFYFAEGSFSIFGARVSTYLSLVAVAAVVIGVALSLFLHRSFAGRAIIATAQNRDAAGLRGVDVQRTIMLAFVIGSVVAGIAGFLMAPYTFAESTVGLPFVLKGFVAAVLGGLTGKRVVEGALVGGFLLGVGEEWLAHLFGFDYRDAGVVLILLIVMLVRPQGIFGTRERLV